MFGREQKQKLRTEMDRKRGSRRELGREIQRE